ncbi:hypothetical protein CK203_024639 [Vitis vinifera]|uniref:Retrotransposon Copia-like N-terminal domain-containing protein n=1 Tax=Vitis vinifera TaxID=29760 RepID=A0A438IUM8_VITVI|nr:hypothetical protein CK203_024639 [Vitis vinifera]
MVKTVMTGATRSTNSTKETTEEVQSGPTVSFNNFENSNTLQITVHRFNGKNYVEWVQSVKLVIDGKDKIGYLTGEVTKPAERDPKFKTWRSKNSMIIAWLINSVEPALGKPFMFLPTTKDQGDRDVMEYYNGMLTLWQELDLCYDDQWECTSDSARHMKREENDRVYVFLLDLTKNWTRMLIKSLQLNLKVLLLLLEDSNMKETSRTTSSQKNHGVTTTSGLGTQERLVGRYMARDKI